MDDERTKWNIVKHTWKEYVPAAVSGTFAITAIVSSNKMNKKKQAALLSLVAMGETAFKEYRGRIQERYGPKEEAKIREEARTSNIPAYMKENEVPSRISGDTLCYDKKSGRYFRSDINKIKSGINRINAKLLSEDWVSVNQLYDQFGIEHIGFGEQQGWSTRNGPELIQFTFDSALTEEGAPYLVIDYDLEVR